MVDVQEDDFFAQLENRPKKTDDPWAPVNLRPDKQEGYLELTSEKYLASLESRLKKMKTVKESEKVAAKELLAGLKNIKDAHMNSLVEATGQPYISDYIPEDNRECVSQSYVQKRLHPEKIALTKEEKELLVEKDNLSKKDERKESLTDKNLEDSVIDEINEQENESKESLETNSEKDIKHQITET